MRRFNKIPKTLKGSTLLESIIASSILLTIATIFFTQQVKINSSLNVEAIYHAHQCIVSSLLQNNVALEETTSTKDGGLIIKKEVLIKENELVKIKVSVIDQSDRVILSRIKWISYRIEI